MPRSKRSAMRAAAARGRRRPAKSGTVPDFAGEFARFGRELDEPIADAPKRGETPTLERLLDWAREIDWVDLLNCLDRIRGSERVDEFGLDPEFEEAIAPLFTFLYRTWWRVE